MLVIVNARSGSLGSQAKREQLKAALSARGVEASIVRFRRSSEIANAIDRHLADGYRLIVAAGGDGTVNATASRLVGSGATLGVIPGGTLNHFAKDLGIPLDLDAAVETLVNGVPARVDAAEVNGRYFLNNSSLGVYPSAVGRREEIQRRGFRKWTAFFLAAVATLHRMPMITVRLEADGRALTRKTPFLFVGNNVYEVEGPKVGSRARLDAGCLCIFVAREIGRLRLLGLAVASLLGRLQDSEHLDVLCARELWIDSPRRVLAVALDGEVTRLAPPLRYRILPGALQVMAPNGAGRS
jgi:diacylglycerol kinase family enzyme